MYKPVRPKSAKGKTRGIRIAHHQQRSEEPTVQPPTRYNPASNTVSRVRRSSTRATEQSTSLVFKSNSRETLLPSSSQSHQTKTPEPEKFPEITRPISSLSKYPILPRISTPSASNIPHSNFADPYGTDINDMALLTHQAQQMILECSARPQPPTNPQPLPRKPNSPVSNINKRKGIKVNTEGAEVNKRKKVFQTQSVFARSEKPKFKKLAQRPKIPREPGENEDRLLIAIKLPDGNRVERYFLPTATMEQILVYAHSRFTIIPIALCTICRMDTIPKTIIDDLSLTLQQLEIKNRTVLYVEEKDE